MLYFVLRNLIQMKFYTAVYYREVYQLPQTSVAPLQHFPMHSMNVCLQLRSIPREISSEMDYSIHIIYSQPFGCIQLGRTSIISTTSE
jgi:hypothetical protein